MPGESAACRVDGWERLASAAAVEAGEAQEPDLELEGLGEYTAGMHSCSWSAAGSSRPGSLPPQGCCRAAASPNATSTITSLPKRLKSAPAKRKGERKLSSRPRKKEPSGQAE